MTIKREEEKNYTVGGLVTRVLCRVSTQWTSLSIQCFRWSCPHTACMYACAVLRRDTWRLEAQMCCGAHIRSSSQLTYGRVSMTFLHVPSASVSYCKPAAVPGPGALSNSPQVPPERIDAESLSQPSIYY